MQDLCPECGAMLVGVRSCRDYFDSLLLLEIEILSTLDKAAEVGQWAHFYAVSTYLLQHPLSMRGTPEMLEGLRQAVAQSLEGSITLSQLRFQTRQRADGATRVLRREGEVFRGMVRGSHTMNVSEVLEIPAQIDAYAEKVREWARLTIQDLSYKA